MSKEPEFKLLSKEEIEKERIKAYKYIDMSKEQTLTDYLESQGILVRLGSKILVTKCIDIIEEFLAKEKEQREDIEQKMLMHFNGKRGSFLNKKLTHEIAEWIKENL